MESQGQQMDMFLWHTNMFQQQKGYWTPVEVFISEIVILFLDAIMTKRSGAGGTATATGFTVPWYQNRRVMIVSKNKQNYELMWSSAFLKEEAGVLYLQQWTKFI